MNETILDFTGIVRGFHRVVTGLNGILYNGIFKQLGFDTVHCSHDQDFSQAWEGCGNLIADLVGFNPSQIQSQLGSSSQKMIRIEMESRIYLKPPSGVYGYGSILKTHSNAAGFWLRTNVNSH